MEKKELLNCYYKLRESIIKKESQRIFIKLKAIISIIIIIISLFATLNNWKYDSDYTLISFLILILGFVVLLKFNGKLTKYSRSYKYNIVKKIIAAYDPSWEYTYNKKVVKDLYRGSKLFSKPFDKYDGQDYIKGVIDGKSFECSTIVTKCKASLFYRFIWRLRYRTIFSGLFFFCEDVVNIQRDLFFVLDYGENHYNTAADCKKFIVDNGRLVIKENNSTNRELSVYTSDEYEASSFLTSGFLDLIKRLKKDYHTNNIYLSLVNGNLYFAISDFRPIFEPSIMSEKNNLNKIEDIYGLCDTLELLVKEIINCSKTHNRKFKINILT